MMTKENINSANGCNLNEVTAGMSDANVEA